MSRHPPRLDEKILEDGDALAIVLDKLLLASEEFHRLSKKIRRKQRRLREHVDEQGWHAYLRVEEATNERASLEAEIMIRWAFREGRRSRRSP